MAVTEAILFRVVQIYKGNILHDLVLHQPKPITLGIHKDFDLVASLTGKEPGYTLFSPTADDRFQLHLYPVSEGGGQLLEGHLTRADGVKTATSELIREGAVIKLNPGDWGLFDVSGSDDVQIFCQYVRLPVRKKHPIVLRPFFALADTATALVDGVIDQYSMLAGVTLLALLFLCFMDAPHGTQFESDRMNRRFSALVRASSKPESSTTKNEKNRSKKQALVVKEAERLTRQPRREPTRTDRVTLTRRDVRNRRINKGALLALNRSIRSSGAARRLFMGKGLDVNLAESLAGTTRSGTTGATGGYSDTEVGTRGASGSDGSVGRGDLGMGPNLGTPIRARGMLTGRGDRGVPKARMQFGFGSVSGTGLSRAQIQSIVRRKRGAIKYCYESALRRNPGMGGGKIIVQFRIGPDGRVIGAGVKANTIGNGGSVGSCISRAVRRWRFPKSAGYAVVRYPFLFSSGLK